MKTIMMKATYHVWKVLTKKRGDFVQQGLLWALIAIAGIAALMFMGDAINTKFLQLAQTFQNANP